jgi:hypothetical protein
MFPTSYEGWHKHQCVPVPKKGDLSDLNKWRGIMLMDMCSKVFSLIMTMRAFQLLDKHGMRFQFGGTPELGCRDGLFTLKALLNAQKTMILCRTWALSTLSKHMTWPTMTDYYASSSTTEPPKNLLQQSK